MSVGEQITQATVPVARKPRKRRSFALRQSDARKWLERLVPPDRITEARVNELAAVVDKYRPGSRYQLIADAMVRNNEMPTLAKVAARHQSRKEAWQRRNTPPEPVDLRGPVVDKLLAVIGQAWEDRGRGPTWVEVGENMGWDRRQTHDALRRLKVEGTVAFTAESGSLARALGGVESS